jgi:hypothetical protein
VSTLASTHKRHKLSNESRSCYIIFNANTLKELTDRVRDHQALERVRERPITLCTLSPSSVFALNLLW